MYVKLTSEMSALTKQKAMVVLGSCLMCVCLCVSAGELESNLLAANQAPAQPKGMLNVNTVSLENATEKHEEPSERIRDDVSEARTRVHSAWAYAAHALAAAHSQAPSGAPVCPVVITGLSCSVSTCSCTQVHFIVNNLSADNVEQRASDIKAKVGLSWQYDARLSGRPACCTCDALHAGNTTGPSVLGT